MRREEGEFLRKRAERFLDLGGRLLDEGTLDLAAFNLHQAAELILKYALFRVVGDYPRTHSIKRLLRLLARATGEEGIMNFLRENVDRVANLENAYVTSRYLPAEFMREEVENLRAATISIFGLVGRVVGDVRAPDRSG